jgi:hypothetical protein
MLDEASGGVTIFREEQRLADTGWIYPVYLSALAAWGGLLARVVMGEEEGDGRPWWLFLLQAVVFGVLFPVVSRDLRLVVEVDQEGVLFRYHPFHRRTHRIRSSDILSARVVTYRPLQDFGGWGIRFGLGRRKAYTVSGRKGVELELSNGWRILLGSCAPDSLLAAVEESMAGSS